MGTIIMEKKIYYSWDDIDWLVETLGRHIVKDCQKNDTTPEESFKGIYGIPRGGLVTAVMLSHRLNIPFVDRLNDMYGERFLIVDDIADTGKTIDQMKRIDVYKGAYYATLNYHQQSSHEPEYWVEEKKDDWIVYPWEI